MSDQTTDDKCSICGETVDTLPVSVGTWTMMLRTGAAMKPRLYHRICVESALVELGRLRMYARSGATYRVRNGDSVTATFIANNQPSGRWFAHFGYTGDMLKDAHGNPIKFQSVDAAFQALVAARPVPVDGSSEDADGE